MAISEAAIGMGFNALKNTESENFVLKPKTSATFVPERHGIACPNTCGIVATAIAVLTEFTAAGSVLNPIPVMILGRTL